MIEVFFSCHLRGWHFIFKLNGYQKGTLMNNGMTKTQKELLRVVFAAVLAALALVVGYIEIRWPIAPWLKLDFSEVVILITFILIGFKHSLGVIVIRSVIRWLISADSTNVPFPFFGETVAIVASIMLVLVYYLISSLLRNNDFIRKKATDKVEIDASLVKKERITYIVKDIVGIILITIIMATFMVVLNFFVVTPSFASQGAYPFFTSFVNSGKYDALIGGSGYWKYGIFVVSVYGPFNLLKFASVMFLFTLIKRPLAAAIEIRP